MPRRRALTEGQLEDLFALPVAESDLIRHWTLSEADLAAIGRRRGDANQLGYALQLCAFRYPGRLLRSGDAIPKPALRFVAEQLRVGPEALLSYAARPQTRREQLDGLRQTFRFQMFAPGHGRELLSWLLPVALATTNVSTIAAALMEELRRRRIVAPGPSVIERLIAAALVLAERHVADQLTRALSPEQVAALDALLIPRDATMSVLAWSRQPPAAPSRRALARIVEQLGCLRAVGSIQSARRPCIRSGCASSRARVDASAPSICAPCRHCVGARPWSQRSWTPSRVSPTTVSLCSIAPSAACSAAPKSARNRPSCAMHAPSTTRSACSRHWVPR